MTDFPILLVLGLLPLVGSIVVAATPRHREALVKQLPLGFSLATLAVTIGVCLAFEPNSGDRFQFTQSISWIRSFGISFALGVDGIALVLIALTAVLVPAVLIGSWNDADRAADAAAVSTVARPSASAAPAGAGSRTGKAGGVASARAADGAASGPAAGGTATALLDEPPEQQAAAVEAGEPEPGGPVLPGTRRGSARTYFALLLLLEATLIGVFAATDVFLFYVFFEAMLVPMYFLVGSFGGPRRQYAAVKFFLYSLLGGLLMLAAVIGLYVSAGKGTFAFTELVGVVDPDVQKLLFLGFFVAFAIKAPLVPFHTWLPDTGAEAPVGGAALLVGVLDKVGMFGLIRYCIPLFPDASRYFTPLVLVLSVIGILYAALLAMGQKDMKRLVAYTSVAHFGFIGLGIFAFTTQSMTGAVFYMVNHGLSTGALFLVVGMVIARGRSRLVGDYGGMATVAPLLGGVFLLAGLSSLALPGMSTFVSEFLVLVGTFTRNRAYAVVATFGIILAALYILLLVQRTMHGPPAGLVLSRPMWDLRSWEAWAVAPLLTLVIVLGVYPKPILDVIRPAVNRTLQDAGRTNPAPTVGAAGQLGTQHSGGDR